MYVHYFFGAFGRLEHLEELLKARTQSVVDPFIPSGAYTLTARTYTTRARSDLKAPQFMCEVRLDAPMYGAPIVIKKKSFRFHKAVAEVSASLKKALRRLSRHRAQHHRREHRRLMDRIWRERTTQRRRAA